MFIILELFLENIILM